MTDIPLVEQVENVLLSRTLTLNERARGVLALVRAAQERPNEEMVGEGQASLDFTPINKCEQQATKVWANMQFVFWRSAGL